MILVRLEVRRPWSREEARLAPWAVLKQSDLSVDDGVMPAPANTSRFRAALPERGFTLIEIMVVMLILAVLLGLVISSFRGARHTTAYRTAQSAATSYAEAIEAYMADNGQVPPKMKVGSAAWPATPRSVRIGGPRDVMMRDKRYLPRAAPEAVGDGIVDLVPASPAMPVQAGAQAKITYSILAEPGSANASVYRLHVQTLPRPGEQTLQCVVTNGRTLPAGVPRCP